MATIRLRYNFPDLPALTDRDGETAGNWFAVGNHNETPPSASSSFYHSGAKSLKIVSSDPGDTTSNYAGLINTYVGTLTVGKQYCLSAWVYTAAAGVGVKFGVGSQLSSEFALTKDTWVYCAYTFTCSAGNTGPGLFIVLQDATTIYVDDMIFSECVELTVLSIKGLDDPDWYELYPAISNTYLDGSKDTQFQAFRRKVRIDCGVLSNRTDRLGVLYWTLDNDRTISYGSEYDLAFVPQQPDGYENEWIEDCSLMRRYVFELDESTVRTTFPV